MPARELMPRLSPEQALRTQSIVEEAFGGYWDFFDAWVANIANLPMTFGQHEWRFGGRAGSGGKLRIDSRRGVYVDAYPEDLTPALAAEILRVNDELRERGSE